MTFFLPLLVFFQIIPDVVANNKVTFSLYLQVCHGKQNRPTRRSLPLKWWYCFKNEHVTQGRSINVLPWHFSARISRLPITCGRWLYPRCVGVLFLTEKKDTRSKGREWERKIKFINILSIRLTVVFQYFELPLSANYIYFLNLHWVEVCNRNCKNPD